MKKILSAFAVMFACILCMPVFTACNSSVGTELKSVAFTKKVFEADVGQPFKLSYKTYPTTAENYSVSFEFDVLNTMYTLDKNGMFTIVDPSCKQINAKITYGAGTKDFDTCTIIQKVYPTEIYFANAVDTINKHGSYNLQLMAKMPDNSVIAIDHSSYNIELTSSASNIINCSDNSMNIVSTGISGTVIIQARIKKLDGSYLGASANNEMGLVAKGEYSVVENVDKAVVAVSTESNFITPSTNRDQTTENTISTTETRVNFKVLLYSSEDVCINNSSVQINAVSGNPGAQITKNVDGTFSIDFNIEEGIVRIEIISNVFDSQGNPKNFIFYITKVKAGA